MLAVLFEIKCKKPNNAKNSASTIGKSFLHILAAQTLEREQKQSTTTSPCVVDSFPLSSSFPSYLRLARISKIFFLRDLSSGTFVTQARFSLSPYQLEARGEHSLGGEALIQGQGAYLFLPLYVERDFRLFLPNRFFKKCICMIAERHQHQILVFFLTSTKKRNQST